MGFGRVWVWVVVWVWVWVVIQVCAPLLTLGLGRVQRPSWFGWVGAGNGGDIFCIQVRDPGGDNIPWTHNDTHNTIEKEKKSVHG